MEFGCRPDERFIIVGTALDMTIAPRHCSGGVLRVYQIVEDGQKLLFLHQVCAAILLPSQILLDFFFPPSLLV